MEVMECLCVFHKGKWHKVKLGEVELSKPFETECEQTVPPTVLDFKHRVPDCPSCWTLEEQNP